MGGIEGLKWYQRVFNFFKRVLRPSDEKAGRVAKASLQTSPVIPSPPSLAGRVQAQRSEVNSCIASLIESKKLKPSLEEISADKRTDFDQARIDTLKLLEEPIPSDPEERMKLALELDIKKDLLAKTLEKSGQQGELGTNHVKLVAAVDERVREIRAPLRLGKIVSILAREIPRSEGRRREEITHLFDELHQNILEILPEGDAKRALDNAYKAYDKARKRFDDCKRKMQAQPELKAVRESYLHAVMKQRASLKEYKESAEQALRGATESGVWDEQRLASQLSAVEVEMGELRKGDLPNKEIRDRLGHSLASFSTQARRRFFFADDRTILDKLSSAQSDSGASKAYHALQGRIAEAQKLLHSWEKLAHIEKEGRKIDSLIRAAQGYSVEELKKGKQTLEGARFVRDQLVLELRGALTEEGRLRVQTTVSKLDQVISAYESLEDRDKSLFSSHGVIESANAFIDGIKEKGGLPIPFENFERQDEALNSLLRNDTGTYSAHFLRMVEGKRTQLRAAWRDYNTPKSPSSPGVTSESSFSSSSSSSAPASPHRHRLQSDLNQTYRNLGPFQARVPHLSEGEKAQYNALQEKRDRAEGEIVLTSIAEKAIRVKELESDLKWMEPQLRAREGAERSALVQGIHERKQELAQLNGELSRLYLQELDYREKGVTSIQVTDSFDRRFTETLYKSVAFNVEQQQRLEARSRERVRKKEELQKVCEAAQGSLEAIQIAEKACHAEIDELRQAIEETAQDLKEKKLKQSVLEREIRLQVGLQRPTQGLEAEKRAWANVISSKEAVLEKLQTRLGQQTQLLSEMETERKSRANRARVAKNNLAPYQEQKREPPSLR